MTDPAIHESEQQEDQPSVPLPGGALGTADVDVTVPTGSAFDDGAEQKFEELGGDEETGELAVAVALREEDNAGGRGYVGKRFIQAAEVRYALVDYDKPFRLVDCGPPVDSCLASLVDLGAALFW